VRRLRTKVVEDKWREFLPLTGANEDSREAYAALFVVARGTSTEELTLYVERGTKGVERNRRSLQGIQSILAMSDDDISAQPDSLRCKTREELVVIQQHGQRELKPYEKEVSIRPRRQFRTVHDAPEWGRTSRGRRACNCGPRRNNNRLLARAAL
jgi:hypothetical protein